MPGKLICVIIIMLMPAAASLADNDIGCGAGTILWEGQNGVIAKVFAVTTNHAFGSQTFGISSGTSECQQGGVITAAARLPMYASANLDRIAADMAAGEGESLDNLAELYGIEMTDRAEFRRTTRTNFAKLFTSENTTAGELLSALNQVMSTNKTLARYVS